MDNKYNVPTTNLHPLSNDIKFIYLNMGAIFMKLYKNRKLYSTMTRVLYIMSWKNILKDVL